MCKAQKRIATIMKNAGFLCFDDIIERYQQEFGGDIKRRTLQATIGRMKKRNDTFVFEERRSRGRPKHVLEISLKWVDENQLNFAKPTRYQHVIDFMANNSYSSYSAVAKQFGISTQTAHWIAYRFGTYTNYSRNLKQPLM